MILATVERFQVEKLIITSEDWSASLQDKSTKEFSDLSGQLQNEVCILPIEKWKVGNIKREVVVAEENTALCNSEQIKFQKCFRTKQLLYGPSKIG